MKKLILAVIFSFTFLVLLYNQVNAQTKDPLTCEEMGKIMNSKECPQWVVYELGLWCAQSFEELIYLPAEGDAVSLYKNRPPDYTLLSDDLSCAGEENAKEDQSPVQKSTPAFQDKKEQSDESRRQEINQPVEEEETISWIKIFGINPFETWLNVKDFIEGAIVLKHLTEFSYYSLSQLGPSQMAENQERERDRQQREAILKIILDEDWDTIQTRESSIPPALENEAWTYRTDGLTTPSTFNTPEVTIVKGQGQLIPHDFYDKIISIDSVDEQLRSATVTVMSGGTPKKAILRYSWGTDSGAVMNVFPKAQIQFLEPVQDKQMQELKRMVKLNKGELEVKVKQASQAKQKEKFGIRTDFLDLYVIGTHFWATHDPDRKFTLVGVYEGTVEVTTKDGKTTTISPEGDKPRVVVVSQRLSVRKLILVGVVLLSLIGVVILLLKKRRKN